MSSISRQSTEHLEKVRRLAAEKFNPYDSSGPLPASLENFIRLFLADLRAEELIAREVADLYGCMMSNWLFLHEYSGPRPKIQIYNPDFESYGWQSTHTVVNVLAPDLPFLVDTVRLALNRHGMTVHLMLHPLLWIKRNAQGELLEITGKPSPPAPLPKGEGSERMPKMECLLHVEIDRQADPRVLGGHELEKVLDDLSAVVADWKPMTQALDRLVERLAEQSPPLESTLAGEVAAFIQWLLAEHFVFMGSAEYHLDAAGAMQRTSGSGLGLLREASATQTIAAALDTLPAMPAAGGIGGLLLVSKIPVHSPVHRSAYLDYVACKLFDHHGEVCGEQRFIGLYTSPVYHMSTLHIPLLHHKVQALLDAAGYAPHSHQARALGNILETYPRDELFQIAPDLLREHADGILQLQERQRVRAFVRPDVYQRFVSCIVYVPRDAYDTTVRKRIQELLRTTFAGDEVMFTVTLSESVLAQVHFIIHIPGGEIPAYDHAQLEARLAEEVRNWREVLRGALLEHFGEARGTQLFQAYGEAFSAAYREDFSPRYAGYDIERLEKLDTPADLELSLYRPLEAGDGSLRFKLYHQGEHLPLSDVLPLLENMGVKVLSERSYAVVSGKKTK